MARLVAVSGRTPADVLTLLDAVWADGDAALVLPHDQPGPDRAATLVRLRPAALRDGVSESRLAGAAPVDAGTALVVTTSGSTGTPSGVVLGHAALDAMVGASRTRLGADDGVPWLGVLPLQHVAGVSVVLRSRAAGREPVLHPRDTPAAIAAAEPSWVSLVPTQLHRLLEAGVDLARHAGVLLGGAAAPVGLLDRARAAGVRVVTSYGSSETSGGCVYDGRPLDGVELRLGDDDRVHVRGPVLAAGRRDANGTSPLVNDDGWYATGDRGAWTTDGRLEVLGRLDRVVVSGGENVPAARVEQVLADHPEVDLVAVVGLPDPTWGAAVTAVVVPTTRDAPPTLEALRTHVGEVLPASWRPVRLVVVDALPRDGMGKVTPASVSAVAGPGNGTDP